MYAPQRLARIAGLFYLLLAFLTIPIVYSRAKVYEPGDAATTTRNVVANADLFRVGFVAELAQAICMTFVALILYALFKHVNRGAALALVIFGALGIAIALGISVFHLAALHLATDASYQDAFGGQGPDALVLLMLHLQNDGYLIAQIYFGLWLLPMGYLAYTSRMFPRALGVVLIVACFGYLADSFTRFLAPDFGAAVSPFVVAPAVIAEPAMILWLLIKGVRTDPGAPPAVPEGSTPEGSIPAVRTGTAASTIG
jgi:hypothetical protein